MRTEDLNKLHEIRKTWKAVKTKMVFTHQKIREMEDLLTQAKADKRRLQQELISLEIEEKYLLGEVKTCKPPKTVFKTDLEKAITKFVKITYFYLSKEDKDAMVKKILADVMT